MTIVKDDVAKVLAAIQALVGKEVLVGIPATTAEREISGDPVNNAELGYIHEYGAPASNVPARPFLIPGISGVMKNITPHMQKAVKAAMDGNASKVEAEMAAAGLIAQAGAQKEINSGAFEPLKPSTIRNRQRSRQTKSMRESEQKYLELIAQGSTPEQAQADAGIRPLINTGELRNSITYVIRKKE